MSIAAIILCFHPDLPAFRKLLLVLRQAQIHVVVVDNSETQAWLLHMPPAERESFDLLVSSVNVGVAEGFNIGLRQVFQDKDCTQSFLFDQDSQITEDNLERIIQFAAESDLRKVRWAAMGPRIYDEWQGKDLIVLERDAAGGLKVSQTATRKNPYSVEFLISSGSLIARQSWEDAGEFESGLFIDFVDIEWAYRAKSKGYESFLCPQAVLHHRLGDSAENLLGMGKKVTLHSPLRLYYMFRNLILLGQKKYVPRDLISYYRRHQGKLLIRTLLKGKGWKALPYIIRGLRDGLRGMSGPMSL